MLTTRTFHSREDAVSNLVIMRKKDEREEST